MSDSSVTQWAVACQPPRPWNSSGKNTKVGSHSILQGIFQTQRSNSSLLHCRQILYHLSHQGSPILDKHRLPEILRVQVLRRQKPCWPYFGSQNRQLSVQWLRVAWSLINNLFIFIPMLLGGSQLLQK